MSADVGENGKRGGGNHGTADRQAIEAVGQVYGIGRAYKHQRNKSHKGQKGQRPQIDMAEQRVHDKIGAKILEERHHQPRGVVALPLHHYQQHTDDCGYEHLQDQLAASSQTEVALMNDL